MYEQIHASNVEQVWHLVAPYIAQAIGDSDTWSDLDAIKQKAKNGYATVWIGRDQEKQIDVVFVTEPWILDGRKALVIRWLCGKNLKEWLPDLEYLEDWAMANGFQAMQVWGRPGWVRVLKPLGYKHEFTVLSKPLIRGLN